jgi:hypothetical protein
MDLLNFILYMKIKERKRNSCMWEKESANGLTRLHIIYDRKGKKKEIAVFEKKNKRMVWPDFILYMKIKERKKIKQIDCLNFILYMTGKERKRNGCIWEKE